MTMDPEIRLAGPADRTAVEETVEAAYTPWIEVIGMRPMPLEGDYGALIEAGHVFVAGPAPARALIVLIPEDERLLVDNVAVRPELHGKGVGRRLLAFAEDRARALGKPGTRLITNERMTSNIALYERLGYRETGREIINGRGIVHMAKDLDSLDSLG